MWIRVIWPDRFVDPPLGLGIVMMRYLRASVAMILLVTLLLYLWSCVPVFRSTGAPLRCRHKLTIIGIALHDYHITYGSFPPAYVADKQGRPMHSWRVLLLPFVDSPALYERYDFSVPWDHPNNRYVLENMPSAYSCPKDPDKEGIVTSYFACFGPNCAFQGATPTRLADMTDGKGDTTEEISTL